MNILNIESYNVIRLGLKCLIEELLPHARLKQSDNFYDSLSLLSNEKFDLVFMDIDKPGGENIWMMQLLKEFQPETLILIHSDHHEALYAYHYIKAGAHAILSKQASRNEVRQALDTIMLKKGKYLSQATQQNLLVQYTASNPQNTPVSLIGMQPHELQVLKLMIRRKSRKEIAHELGLKENSVNIYKNRIFRKLKEEDEIRLAEKCSEAD
ncbi:response regulator transcription factor [Dyadobacter frigoris]|uniref:Response regulator transcription factor n=1 Tax=Dyadobacter frigoris TaxID=2576211 RepID=A0A4U6CMP3_9BACT|nr:response regulator transcription factor [Dyadobacter frigoris]TKT85316.1 response regulator transcription factor [Dyadobacter frigoris]GLU56953.1 hypothetical protein Dfri01_64140 [Dyadobacter frigoris]